MEMNLAYVNVDNLKDNFDFIKSNYTFTHYILNVSNNAFGHGLEIVKYLDSEIDYLYTSIFSDVVRIRKYNHDFKIIYSGIITEDNIFDLVLNNAIIVIKSKDILDFILSLKIKDKFDIILNIDLDDFNGINSKIEVADILEDLKSHIHINILGVMSSITEDHYQDFKYTINPLKSLDLVILNNESDKNKIKGSNAIILEKSIYGIDDKKRKLFSKEVSPLKPILNVTSYIDKVVTLRKGKKENCVGVMPFGWVHGFPKCITKVYIKNKLYNIREIDAEYTLIDIDDAVKENDKIEVIGVNNRLDSYIKDDIFNNIMGITSCIDKVFEEKVKNS